MFGIDNYQTLLKNISSKGWNFSTDWEIIDKKKNILLRHDIDFSIEDALITAEIEKKLEIKSTFFFMLTSNMYNIFSSYNRNLIERIIESGHKVSVHFDPTAYTTLDSFKEEKYIFERMFNVNVDIVSIHRPGIFLENNNQSLNGIAHTYQDKYFKDIKYISDSGGSDVNQKLSEHFSSKCQSTFQLLLHPIWWTSKEKNPTSTLNKCIENKLKFLYEETELNCKTYKR